MNILIFVKINNDLFLGYPSTKSHPEIYAGGDQGSGMDEQMIGIVVGAGGALLLLIIVITIGCILRHRHHKYTSGQGVKDTPLPPHVTLNLHAPLNGKLTKGIVYNSVATSDGDSDRDEQKLTNGGSDLYNNIQSRKLPEPPAHNSLG